MKVAAPGKLLLTGQYAVLEGAPALVMAIERLAVADGEVLDLTPTREVRAAYPGEAPPHVDLRALHDGDRKLGLGSSAAALVAALGVRAASRKEDLSAPDVRRRLVDEAYAVHQSVQGGGSGVDIAASVHGGTLHYERVMGKPRVRPLIMPFGLMMVALWSGKPSRTSELLAQVNDVKRTRSEDYRKAMRRLGVASCMCGRAVDEGSVIFLHAVAELAAALEAFADATGASIVPEPWRELGALARERRSIFLPSGAGGGDFGLYMSIVPPTDRWLERAATLGFHPVALSEDTRGVRVLS
jgi:phosphomevalonate kinase